MTDEELERLVKTSTRALNALAVHKRTGSLTSWRVFMAELDRKKERDRHLREDDEIPL